MPFLQSTMPSRTISSPTVFSFNGPPRVGVALLIFDKSFIYLTEHARAEEDETPRIYYLMYVCVSLRKLERLKNFFQQRKKTLPAFYVGEEKTTWTEKVARCHGPRAKNSDPFAANPFLAFFFSFTFTFFFWARQFGSLVFTSNKEYSSRGKSPGAPSTGVYTRVYRAILCGERDEKMGPASSEVFAEAWLTETLRSFSF